MSKKREIKKARQEFFIRYLIENNLTNPISNKRDLTTIRFHNKNVQKLSIFSIKRYDALKKHYDNKTVASIDIDFLINSNTLK